MCKIFIITFLYLLPSVIHAQIVVDSLVQKQYEHSYINKVMAVFEEDVLPTLPNWNISSHSVKAEKQIELLKQDFNIRFLDAFIFAKSCSFNVYYGENNKLHLGIIEIGLSSPKEADRIYKTITTTGRTNLKLKVLTKFKVLKKGSNLIFLLSETALNADVMGFFDKMGKIL